MNRPTPHQRHTSYSRLRVTDGARWDVQRNSMGGAL